MLVIILVFKLYIGRNGGLTVYTMQLVLCVGSYNRKHGTNPGTFLVTGTGYADIAVLRKDTLGHGHSN